MPISKKDIKKWAQSLSMAIKSDNRSDIWIRFVNKTAFLGVSIPDGLKGNSFCSNAALIVPVQYDGEERTFLLSKKSFPDRKGFERDMSDFKKFLLGLPSIDNIHFELQESKVTLFFESGDLSYFQSFPLYDEWSNALNVGIPQLDNYRLVTFNKSWLAKAVDVINGCTNDFFKPQRVSLDTCLTIKLVVDDRHANAFVTDRHMLASHQFPSRNFMLGSTYLFRYRDAVRILKTEPSATFMISADKNKMFIADGSVWYSFNVFISGDIEQSSNPDYDFIINATLKSDSFGEVTIKDIDALSIALESTPYEVIMFQRGKVTIGREPNSYASGVPSDFKPSVDLTHYFDLPDGSYLDVCSICGESMSFSMHLFKNAIKAAASGRILFYKQSALFGEVLESGDSYQGDFAIVMKKNILPANENN